MLNERQKKTGVTFWLLLVSMSCGGGPTFAHGVFREGERTFRVGALPTGWDRVDVDGQNDLAWYHAKLQAAIQVNASCDPEMDIPLEALTNHLLIGFTERQISEERLVPMDQREALRMVLVAKLDGVPRKMALIVLKKDGCVYDFSLIAPADDHFSVAMPHFESLLAGFRAENKR
jgi:hypothetical protein